MPDPQNPTRAMFTRPFADAVAHAYLRKMAEKMDVFGSALPENKDRQAHHFVITRVEEHDFGWVYRYNASDYLESGNFEHFLAGNSPFIVSREDGKLYATGTAKPLEHYLADFRSGERFPL